MLLRKCRNSNGFFFNWASYKRKEERNHYFQNEPQILVEEDWTEFILRFPLNEAWAYEWVLIKPKHLVNKIVLKKWLKISYVNIFLENLLRR